jgi:hypothetical protein
VDCCDVDCCDVDCCDVDCGLFGKNTCQSREF